MSRLRWLLYVSLLVLSGCVSVEMPADQCPPDKQALVNCPPPEAIDDPELNTWYELRTWVSPGERDLDLIDMGIRARIPVKDARVKLLGSNEQDALYSLAAKIYLIEQAQHSIDAMYYIFTADLAGSAMLGALCQAVKRGVDIRLMIDSIGSISMDRNLLRALYQCQLEGGFIRNRRGELTTRRARVQAIIFNPLSDVFSNPNRRSHDKILIVDGFVPEKAIVLTGGRNISLDYYGIHADGSPNPDTYLDAELLLRPGTDDRGEIEPRNAASLTVSEVSEIYFSLLAGYKSNRHVQGRVPPDRKSAFGETEAKLHRALARLKSLPAVRESLQAMPVYLASGYRRSDVLLAHEFGNLIDRNVVTDAVANIDKNPNSIIYLLSKAQSGGKRHFRMVSPYLFLARYYGPDGEVLLDEAQNLKRWLDGDPERTVEIITNSVLTSDNFFAQAMVDMDMAPRVLLDDDHLQKWRTKPAEGELNPELVNSETWRRLVQNPRLRVYETGRLDDVLLGGNTDYGKLHAKYFLADDQGFLGTANFDYRSRLFNNEMGFFFEGAGLAADLVDDFDYLRSKSYLWGSPEWLEMRKRLVEKGGVKGYTTRHQHQLFRFLRATGLKWFF